ncbi:MAG: hypothetical protein L7T83_03040 [Ilumatobacteraceae bacterium]|nr:hypothetical protein [Ilumatobacteraceae bacterium]
MTIRIGEEWGEPVDSAPEGTRTAFTDHDVAQALDVQHPVLVRGGTLHKTLGSPIGDAVIRRLPIDLVEMVDTSSETRIAVSVANISLSLRRPLGRWRGRIVVATNCGEYAGVTPCPRAHPNDGMFDVLEVDASMTLLQRRLAWKKAKSGSHLPHPSLSVRSGDKFCLIVEPNERIIVDGVDFKFAGEVELRAVADAGEIFI